MKFIAELCQNHNGSYENLKKMTIECAKNGADIMGFNILCLNRSVLDLNLRPV